MLLPPPNTPVGVCNEQKHFLIHIFEHFLFLKNIPHTEILLSVTRIVLFEGDKALKEGFFVWSICAIHGAPSFHLSHRRVIQCLQHSFLLEILHDCTTWLAAASGATILAWHDAFWNRCCPSLLVHPDRCDVCFPTLEILLFHLL